MRARTRNQRSRRPARRRSAAAPRTGVRCARLQPARKCLCQLEVLRDPTTEDQPSARVGGVGERDRVPGAVRSRRRRTPRSQVRPTEVSRRAPSGPLPGSRRRRRRPAASLTSAPGSGTPMQRASLNGKCALVTAGAVSVAPQDPVTGTWQPRVRSATAPSRSRSAAGSAAAASNISLSREKNRAANSGSASSAGTSGIARGDVEVDGRRHIGEVLDRLPNSPGAGRPPSTYSVPSELSIMFTLWLPPNVWLHGSQSTITGRSWRRKGQACPIIRWLAASIRWVFSTPFGDPVDPDVKRIFAIPSGLRRRKQCARYRRVSWSAERTAVPRRLGDPCSPARGCRASTSSAAAKAAASAAKPRRADQLGDLPDPGVSGSAASRRR